MLKFEIKVPLTKEEYECLQQLNCDDLSSQYHTNYYYDSNTFEMDRLGITCRIREINGNYEATLKAHQSKESECSIVHSVIAINEYDNTLFKTLNVNLQGYLITQRTTLLSCKDIKIYFDKNYYLNTIDYELEIEYSPEYENQANQLFIFFAKTLNNLNIIYGVKEFYERRYYSKSKSGRFISKIKQFIHK